MNKQSGVVDTASSLMGVPGGLLGLLSRFFGSPYQARTTIKDSNGVPRTVYLQNALPRTAANAANMAQYAGVMKKYAPDYDKAYSSGGRKLLANWGAIKDPNAAPDPSQGFVNLVAPLLGRVAAGAQGIDPSETQRHVDHMVRMKNYGSSDAAIDAYAQRSGDYLKKLHGIGEDGQLSPDIMPSTSVSESRTATC
jgi:hypothetical protein